MPEGVGNQGNVVVVDPLFENEGAVADEIASLDPSVALGLNDIGADGSSRPDCQLLKEAAVRLDQREEDRKRVRGANTDRLTKGCELGIGRGLGGGLGA